LEINMKRAIETGIPRHERPFEWAILANGTLYAVAAPIKADGEVERGEISAQAKLTLGNLSKCMSAAGGSMADVTQVMLYVTQRAHIEPINTEWAKAFPKPYPTRATVIVSEIGIEGIGLVITAQGCIAKNSP
jgi:2-iminobutanoate/2-iminopropanoate deaminase